MKLNKIFKWGMVVLIIISVAILIWGFVSGFATPKPNQVALPPTNTLLTWAAIMIIFALFCWICIGLYVSIKNNPKSLVKMGIVLVGIAVLCFIAYLFAKGGAPVAYSGKPYSESIYKMSDTVLNLTLITGIGAILAIVVGEIRMAIANKK